MALPSISVVIPTYNRSALVPRAVASALAQVEPGDEVIVVDDGSTDDTDLALAPFGDRIRFMRCSNGGAGAARNRGIREARRELVAFLDSDDEWMPGKLHLQRTLLARRTDILFCFSNFAVRDADGAIHPGYLARWHGQLHRGDAASELPLRAALTDRALFSSLASLPEGWSDFLVLTGDLALVELASSCVLTSSLVARRSAGDALRFAEDVPTWEDWECFGRLALAGTAAFLDVDTTWQHGHSGPRLSGAGSLRRSQAQLRIAQRVWGSSPEFLRKHGAAYARLEASFANTLARELLACGRTSEALALLAEVPGASRFYRALAWMPPASLSALIRLRDRIGQRLRG